MNARTTYPCPCCGFASFSEPPGSYEICTVCGWEDDHVQLRNPDMSGGANHDSLRAAQISALGRLPPEVTSVKGMQRTKDWRPLNASDVFDSPAPISGGEYFHAAAEDEEPKYYWESSLGNAG